MTYEIVVIGASWGGLDALKVVLSGLPTSFSTPIAIVQHRSPSSRDEGLTAYFDGICPLSVRTVDDKDPIEPGHVYVAPPDYHLLVDRGYFEVSIDLPIQFSRPSVDVLFDSAADAYGAATVGVILTGANSDGAEGLAAIKRAGGFTIVQDPATAIRTDMPRAAIQAVGEPDLVTSLDEIATFLTKLDGES